ncbi:UDP-N-acetylmuramoyl-tripeptide--D-alanyl-D-alanine ligase [Agarivorans sp. TSD2052]|uniref:UDP-N-acetylmuramoyl-tripeptide--D-alanyl-D- alanine ligase n=1 Tax=Agarivorans sp. TSD2052 TaxID=2937286 RepID=UPI00200FD1D2|nr:UDP-N-acetylmuramoyl-tripeptide--D-alanyl-D-alanine ligase [Agarivorans sp. TSD2052]UPW17945.1 UDP-N-acetylmuramoyl-tripeptide--D-alanyl-D-alanine ligase [Agarivorans sp. TSD2052]
MLSELLAPLNAQLIGNDCLIQSVDTDSRKAMPKGLFVALSGENFDGHQFAEAAIQQGALALIVEQKQALPVPQLLVADCRLALGHIASYLRDKLQLPCCAITGSNGKTTVKEMCSSILSQAKDVLATQGNFNNDIGVPLSLLRATEQHQVGVLELGANHIGEIAYTVNLVKPKVALINNVSAAHIEGFGDQAGVLKAKSELFQNLNAEQLAICEAGSDYQQTLMDAAKPAKVQLFSLDDCKADYYASDIVSMGVQGSQFTLNTPYGMQTVQVNMAGQHNVKNAVAASALALAMGATLSEVQLGLAQLDNVPGRVNLQPLSQQVSLIDDSYNANPASFKAAIDILASFEGHRFLVAGAMGEMGQDSEQAHKSVVQQALDSGISLYSYGASFESALADLGQLERFFDSHEQLVEQLTEALKQTSQQPCLILVKGSRSTHMEKVVQHLQHNFKKGFEC